MDIKEELMKINFNNLRDLLIFNIKYYRYVNNYSQEKLAEYPLVAAAPVKKASFRELVSRLIQKTAGRA